MSPHSLAHFNDDGKFLAWHYSMEEPNEFSGLELCRCRQR